MMNYKKIFWPCISVNEQFIFKSWESKTKDNKPVYNQITLKTEGSNDIWEMKQSHSGRGSSKWGHIRIIVHKERKPYVVSYHQLKNGKEVEFKTNCFRCHSNGPRLIRPSPEDYSSLSLKKKITLKKWNFLIKSYGPLRIKKNNPFKRKISLIKKEMRVLNLKSCISCHAEDSARLPFKVNHLATAHFLVKTGQMPPWPYKISIADKNTINRYFYGF